MTWSERTGTPLRARLVIDPPTSSFRRRQLPRCRRPARGARRAPARECCSARATSRSSTTAGVAALGGLGIRRIIDLRADEEVAARAQPSRRARAADPARAAVPRLGRVVLRGRHPASTRCTAGSWRSAERVVEVVRGIVADQPVLVHCTVGKDRTGVTVALALAAAGVDREAVVADYARTEQLLPAVAQQRVVEDLRTHASGSGRTSRTSRRGRPRRSCETCSSELDRALRFAGRLSAGARAGR